MSYELTRARVEDYFDRTATRTWEALTSDAKVSRIRETVRRGRDAMRERLLAALPADLSGARVLDAGCGAGQLSQELARRGADVLGVDIAPEILKIAERRTPEALRPRVRFRSADMLDAGLGHFDHTVAMDSLIYYAPADLDAALDRLAAQSGSLAFTVAPRTPLLMMMWQVGRLFPRSDRSPLMVPQAPDRLIARHGARDLGRITTGFYISHALEIRA
ncbi:magnesium protoporphyrin IX methyltransferase [Roseivivax sp.]